METIILIMILKIGNNNSVTSMSAEFNSIKNCREAALAIEKKVNQSSYVSVVSWGCYEK